LSRQQARNKGKISPNPRDFQNIFKAPKAFLIKQVATIMTLENIDWL